MIVLFLDGAVRVLRVVWAGWKLTGLVVGVPLLKQDRTVESWTRTLSPRDDCRIGGGGGVARSCNKCISLGSTPCSVAETE
jgi:hypothetical protein